MKACLLSAGLLMTSLSCLAEAEWKTLFNGRDFEGWRNYGSADTTVRRWSVENGSLTVSEDVNILTTLFEQHSTDLIYYPEQFDHFELRLEWRVQAGGNSGIFYLVDGEKRDRPWDTGLEMQVLDNEGHWDRWFDTHRAGDLYDLKAASPETVRPAGEWNTVRVRVQGAHIEHWLNGVKVLEIERGSSEWNERMAESKFADMPGYGMAARGHIVLQDHSDRVWYRNIQIRRLR